MGASVNLPNAITLGRIFLVPLLVVVLLTKFDGLRLFGVSKEIIGASIFGVASLTDWLDGFLARRRGQVTELGQWMDPLADKLLVTAALISSSDKLKLGIKSFSCADLIFPLSKMRGFFSFCSNQA